MKTPAMEAAESVQGHIHYVVEKEGVEALHTQEEQQILAIIIEREVSAHYKALLDRLPRSGENEDMSIWCSGCDAELMWDGDVNKDPDPKDLKHGPDCVWKILDEESGK